MKKISKYLFGFFLLSLLGITISCKKELSEVGNELQPPEELLEVKFQTPETIQAFSLPDDPFLLGSSTSAIAGYLKDDVFGTSKAGFSLNFSQPSNNITFGNNPRVEEVVLSLQYRRSTTDKYTGYYGDTLSNLSYNVYRLPEAVDNKNLTDVEPKVTPQDLLVNNFVFSPRPNDSVAFKKPGDSEEKKYIPQVRIKLPNSLGEDFLKYIAENPTNTTESFQEFFKGVYVEATGIDNDKQGVLPRFDISSKNLYTKIEFYYSNTNSTGDRVYGSYSFISSAKSYRSAFYKHIPSDSKNTNFKDQIINGNKDAGRKQIYVQGISGVKSVVKFSGLREWANDMQKDGAVLAINSANIVFPQKAESSDEDIYRTTSKLFLSFNLPNGLFLNIPDRDILGDSFGGSFDEKTKAYKFNISRYVQGVIEGEKTLLNGEYFDWEEIGLKLQNNYYTTDPSRVIINGVDADGVEPDQKMHLEIIYTLIK
ncbi:MAG: DUF4270 family protein [Bacteroidales bacterium]